MMKNIFNNCILKENLFNIYNFIVSGEKEKISIGKLLKIFQINKAELNLKEYSITSTNLEIVLEKIESENDKK